MNTQQWNEGLDHIDPELVAQHIDQKEKYTKRKRIRTWHRAVAIAACLCLIVGIAALFPNHPQEIPPKNQYIPYQHLQTPSAAPLYYGEEHTMGGSIPSFERAGHGISVTARLIETLPDTYTFYNDWDQIEYRLLRMEVVKLLKGKEMTDEFYYLIPVDFMSDYSIYDRFVIRHMAQFGFEYSVLYNKTQDCAEQLDQVLFGYITYGSSFLGEGFLAYDHTGSFDERLWNSTEEWKKWTEHATSFRSLSEAEEYARSEYGNFSVHMLDELSGRPAEVLEWLRSFENGLYVPETSGQTMHLYPEVQLHFTRYLNGFPSNEVIRIESKWDEDDVDTVTFTKARFTEEDLNALPDLRSVVVAVSDAYDAGRVVPPHFEYTSDEAHTTHGIFGWYAKTEDGVIGIVRVTFCIYQKPVRHYDDAYFIVEYGSDTYSPIDRDDLLERLGDYETTYIYEGDYDESGKIRPIMPLT